MAVPHSLFGKYSKYNISAFSISFEIGDIDPQGGFLTNQDDHIMHEYFHLVQASSTIFGLWNFITYIISFLEISQASRRNGDTNKFAQGFNSWEKMEDKKEIIRVQDSLFEKDLVMFAQSITFKRFSKTKKQNIKTSEGEHPFPSICAEFDNNGSPLNYELVPRTFYEAYSKCVDFETNQKPYHVPYGSDQFYYYAVLIILHQLFPNISNAQCAVILHWSLNSISPGEFFKEIIEYLQTNHNTTLPPPHDLSIDIRDNVFQQYSHLLDDTLGKLYGLFQSYQEDGILGSILKDLYNFYDQNLSYIAYNLDPPCLSMYPFVLTPGQIMPRISQCMAHNTTILPLPLYFRPENGYAYTATPIPFSNYSKVTSLLCVFEMVKNGSLIYGCPIHNACALPCKDDSCLHHLYKKDASCEIITILKMFK